MPRVIAKQHNRRQGHLSALQNSCQLIELFRWDCFQMGAVLFLPQKVILQFHRIQRFHGGPRHFPNIVPIFLTEGLVAVNLIFGSFGLSAFSHADIKKPCNRPFAVLKQGLSVISTGGISAETNTFSSSAYTVKTGRTTGVICSPYSITFFANPVGHIRLL